MKYFVAEQATIEPCLLLKIIFFGESCFFLLAFNKRLKIFYGRWSGKMRVSLYEIADFQLFFFSLCFSSCTLLSGSSVFE